MGGGVSTIRVSQGYLPRQVQFQGIWELAGWRWKVYTLRYQEREEAGTDFLEWARTLAMERVGGRLPDSTVYGAGFVIAHTGRFGDYVLVNWWADEDILYSSIYETRPGGVEDFALNPSQGLTACVWELAVVDFERRAWVETVLQADGTSSLDDYFSRTFSGLV